MVELQSLLPVAFMIDTGGMQVGTSISLPTERTKPFLWKCLGWKHRWNLDPVITSELTACGPSYIYPSGWKLPSRIPTTVFFLLGGKRLPDDLHAVHEMLSQFWERHQFVDGRCTAPKEPRCTIPYFIHGDEGRGQVKRPILVVSFQPLFSWGGEQTLNLGKILVPIEFFPCILCTSDL